MFVQTWRSDVRSLAALAPMLWRLWTRHLSAPGPARRATLQALMTGLRHRPLARWRAWRQGVPLPVTLQVVDDVSCRAGCAHCTFLGFTVRGPRLDLRDLDRLFLQARQMGITQVYLMGADPFYREDAGDLLALLARHRGQVFLLFTEGRRVLEGGHLDALTEAGNIVPVLNVDGGPETTEARKGPGAAQDQQRLMEALRERRIPWFVTTMIHRDNHDEVTGLPFLQRLEELGAWLLAYVPYVPTDPKGDGALVLDPERRERLFDRVREQNRHLARMVTMDLLGLEQRVTDCPAGVHSLTVWHDGTLSPCPAVALGMEGSCVRNRPLWDLWVEDRLLQGLRQRRRETEARGEQVHCQFFVDPSWLREFVLTHPREIRVLSPGTLRVLGIAETLQVGTSADRLPTEGRTDTGDVGKTNAGADGTPGS